MPRYILECSSLNLDLLGNEIRALSYNFGDFDIESQIKQVFIISGNWKTVTQSSFVNTVSEIIQVTDNPEDFDGSRIPDGKYYVRLKQYSSTPVAYTESAIGSILQAEGKVSFTEPNFVIRVIRAERWYLCIIRYDRDRKELEQRRAPMRPFFSPVSLHPKFGRYLVNVSMTKPGDLVLDPFCGTGGILIEAAMMGRRIVGSDISLSMVMGARLNLKYFGYSDAKILRSSVSELDLDEKVTAIITDMPYGRNSSLHGDNIEQLYQESFAAFHNLLVDKGHCALIVGDSSLLELSNEFFSLVSMVPVPQHKSLTRYFTVVRKK
ncbi:MAG: DNA methyltransferase [Thermoplasmataceae archaeon]